MIPANFPFQNGVLRGKSDKAIEDLPCYVYPERNQFISCWKFDAEELASMQKSGVVWLYVWGSHPPVHVSGLSPFREAVVKSPEHSRQSLLELATWHAEQAHVIHQFLENSQIGDDNDNRPQRFTDEDGFERAARIMKQGGVFAPWLEESHASPEHHVHASSEGEELRREDPARAEVDPAEAGRDADPGPQDASGGGGSVDP